MKHGRVSCLQCQVKTQTLNCMSNAYIIKSDCNNDFVMIISGRRCCLWKRSISIQTHKPEMKMLLLENRLSCGFRLQTLVRLRTFTVWKMNLLYLHKHDEIMTNMFLSVFQQKSRISSSFLFIRFQKQLWKKSMNCMMFIRMFHSCGNLT